MPDPSNRDNLDRRVLLVTPTRRDGEITSSFFAKAGLSCLVCRDLSHLAVEIASGAGAVLLTEEATASGAMREVIAVLHQQPAWSDLPIVVLTRGSASATESNQTFKDFTNVTLLERPAPIRSVISAVESAVRGRLRQYQIRDQIEAIRIAKDEREQSLERERSARQEAERVSRVKDEFLAVLSHELRTPLTPVLMTVTAMELDPGLPPLIREDIEMIRRNVQLECKLIDDLLDMSRITSGKLTLQLERLGIDEILRQTCEIVREKFREKGVRLHCNLYSCDGRVNGDSARLHQIFWNLLNNAAKFTPEGGDVFVTSKLAGDFVHVTIHDTGIGIAPHLLPRIFDAFEQGESSITRQFGGLGLGLAITRLLVEAHHGQIQAHSDGAGRGTAFTVELPAVRVARSTSNAPSSDGIADANERPLRVMLVEDHADTAAVLSRLLAMDGHDVQTASTAADALELASSRTFDLVISDLGLPDMTGYDLMKQIKARHNITGIAMSGYGMEEDILRSRGAGFSDHIVKPVTIDRLEQSIRRVVLNSVAKV